MRVLLVVNASASAVTPRVRVVIAKALAVDHDVIVSDTEGPGHATRLAAEAAGGGYDAVVAFGGDGTVNEVANGLAGTSTALGVLPGGSTNVFARTIGAARDPVDAGAQLVVALREGRTGRIGMGVVAGVGTEGGRGFLFNLGLGFDAAVIDRVEQRGHLKRYAGHPLFVAAAVSTYVRHYDRRRPGFRVHAGGEAAEDSYFAVFMNSDPYTFLGRRPLHLSPGTGPDTGLGLVSFRALTLRAMVLTTAAALGSGRAVGRRGPVTARRGLRRALIEADRPFPYQADGEFLGVTPRLEIEHRPAALDLLRPPPLAGCPRLDDAEGDRCGRRGPM